jgi:PHD/YefM family antitoxin component YafN of YafNO toxin-antitoxin module
MIDATQDVQPLATFRENSAELIEYLKTTHRPITLTVDGQTAIVIQEAAAYQRLLDLASEADEDEGLRQARADVIAGRTRPAREVFDEMRKEYRIPR